MAEWNLASATLQLQWGDGRVSKLGTLEIKTDEYRLRGHYRVRLGLEIVKYGLWIMFPRRKRGEEENCDRD